MAVPRPRVATDKASVKTRRRRSLSLQTIRKAVSMGSSAAQLLDETKHCSLAEREQLIQQLQHGVKVVIPAGVALAMKTATNQPWNQLRKVRR